MTSFHRLPPTKPSQPVLLFCCFWEPSSSSGYFRRFSPPLSIYLLSFEISGRTCEITLSRCKLIYPGIVITQSFSTLNTQDMMFNSQSPVCLSAFTSFFMMLSHTCGKLHLRTLKHLGLSKTLKGSIRDCMILYCVIRCKYLICHHLIDVHLYKFFTCLDINKTCLNQTAPSSVSVEAWVQGSGVYGLFHSLFKPSGFCG